MQKYHRLVILGIVLGLLAFIVMTLLSDVQQLRATAMAFPWLLMSLALGLRIVNWVIRCAKWHFYLRLVGVGNLSIRDSVAIYVAGFPLSASPGKVAEILKSFMIKDLTGTPIATTLPVLAAERLSDGLSVLLLLAWAIAGLAAAQYWPVAITSASLIIVGIIILQIRPLCLKILRLLTRLPVIGRFARSFELFYESSYRIVQLRNILIAVGMGTLANSLDGVGMFLILVGLGRPATQATFFQALLAISLSVVAGSVTGAPGGVGAADLTIAGTLQALVGLSAAEAGFATILARFIQFWWGVLVGSIVVFLYRKRLFSSALERSIADYQRQPTHHKDGLAAPSYRDSADSGVEILASSPD